MSKVDDEENRNSNIGCQERGHAPILRPEDAEAIDEGQDDESNDGSVWSPWLHYWCVGEFGVGDALDLASFAESKVDDWAADPGDKAWSVGQVDEPVEDHGAWL